MTTALGRAEGRRASIDWYLGMPVFFEASEQMLNPWHRYRNPRSCCVPHAVGIYVVAPRTRLRVREGATAARPSLRGGGSAILRLVQPLRLPLHHWHGTLRGNAKIAVEEKEGTGSSFAPWAGLYVSFRVAA